MIEENLFIRRVLFVSFACYLDDANGAAVASRAMMEALARGGFAVEALSGPILECATEADLSAVLTARVLPIQIHGFDAWDAEARRPRPQAPNFACLELLGVPVTIMWGPTSPHAPSDDEQRGFLYLFDGVCSRFRPDVVVAFGGGLLIREVLRRAKVRGRPSCFRFTTLIITIPPRSPTSMRCLSPASTRPSIIAAISDSRARCCRTWLIS